MQQILNLKVQSLLCLVIFFVVVGWLGRIWYMNQLAKHLRMEFKWMTATLFRDDAAGVEGWTDHDGITIGSWKIGKDDWKPPFANKLPPGFKTRVMVVSIGRATEIKFDWDNLAKACTVAESTSASKT